MNYRCIIVCCVWSYGSLPWIYAWIYMFIWHMSRICGCLSLHWVEWTVSSFSCPLVVFYSEINENCSSPLPLRKMQFSFHSCFDLLPFHCQFSDLFSRICSDSVSHCSPHVEIAPSVSHISAFPYSLPSVPHKQISHYNCCSCIYFLSHCHLKAELCMQKV